MTPTLAAHPIGIFDSGVGGLSVWRAVVQHLPHESTLYFADQSHVPYGPRPLTEIRTFSQNITRFLRQHGAKLIVVACNTASGAALHYLRQTFPDMPFVGMEPAIKPAIERTRTGAVGILATPATFQGDLFQRLAARFANQATLYTQTCPGLVAAVESGALDTPATRALLQQYLRPLLDAGIDQLVLGCTHYPFLSHNIQTLSGPEVTLIDPAPAVARQVQRMLAQRDALTAHPPTPTHHFYTSGDAPTFAQQAQHLVGYTGPVTHVSEMFF